MPERAGPWPSGRQLVPFAIGWLGVSVAAVVVAVVSGLRNDYALYVGAWRLVNDDSDPWQIGAFNAYGPFFNALSPLVRIHELAPKLVFVGAWSLVAAAVVVIALRVEGPIRAAWALALVVLNPLFILSTGLFGTFDAFVAAICVAALLAFRNERPLMSGTLVAAATLLKFYPVVLIPVLAVRCARARTARAFLAGSLGGIATGVGASLVVWGSSTFEPLRLGGDRPSTMASVFRFLSGRWSPLRAFTDTPDVDVVSGPLVVVGVVGVTWWVHRRRVDATLAAATVLAVTFLTYRVGHPQFVQVVVLLLALAGATGALPGGRAQLAAATYALWYGAIQVAYVWTAYDIGLPEVGFEGEWAWVRDVLGAPTFVLTVWLVVELVLVAEPVAADAVARDRFSGSAARAGRAERSDSAGRVVRAIRGG